MRSLVVLPILILLAVAPSARAQDDAKGLIEKAIRAHGGEANVAKLKSASIKVEGEGEFAEGQPAVPVVLEDVWQMPNRYKTTSHLTLQGKKFTQTLCINGKEGWAEVDGQAQPLPPEGLKEMKEQKWAEDFDRLLPLRDKSLKLTRIADSKVEGHLAAGLKEAGKPVVQSVAFSGFVDKGGIKHWTGVTAFRDGRRFITAKLKELETDGKGDAKEFAKPGDPPPPPGPRL